MELRFNTLAKCPHCKKMSRSPWTSFHVSPQAGRESQADDTEDSDEEWTPKKEARYSGPSPEDSSSPSTSSPHILTNNIEHASLYEADLPEDKLQYTKHCICIKLTARSLAKSCHLTKVLGMGKGMTFAYWSSKFTLQMGMNTQSKAVLKPNTGEKTTVVSPYP
ncbi:uncharacterized protein RBU33_011657 isoform 1-T1 [Hipposideros larvatus]